MATETGRYSETTTADSEQKRKSEAEKMIHTVHKVFPYFIFLFFTLAIFSCSKKVKPEAVKDVSSLMENGVLLCSIERTSCYGKCPTYKLEIYNNGLILYEGIRFVDNIGKYSGSIKKEDLSGILLEAEEIGYFEMEDEYPVEGQAPSDLPQTITMIMRGKETKKIVNRNYDSPPSLIDFEMFIDNLVNNAEWHLFDSDMAK